MSVIPSWLKFWSNGNESNEFKDSSYEDEVMERCDHDFETTTELLDTAALAEAELIGGYLVFPQYEKVEEYCTNCGEPGLNGEPVPEPDFVHTDGIERTGERVEVAHRIAVPYYQLDPGASIPEDVLDDGVTVIEGEDDGRVIVNESEQD